MDGSLFMFLAQGVVAHVSGFRAGARHAPMLFGTGATIEAARSKALEGAISKGWTHTETKGEKELGSSAAAIADDVLRLAGETACSKGSALVVYADELPLDS